MLKLSLVEEPYDLAACEIHNLVNEPTRDWIYGVIRFFTLSELVKRVDDTAVDGYLVCLAGRHKPSVRMFGFLLAPKESFTMLALIHAREIIAKYTSNDMDKIIHHMIDNHSAHKTLNHLLDFIVKEDFDMESDVIANILKDIHDP